MENQGLLFKDVFLLKLMRESFLRDLATGNGTAGAGSGRHMNEYLAVLDLSPSFAYPAMALLEPAASGADELLERRRTAERIKDFVDDHSTGGLISFLEEEGRIGLLFSWVQRGAVEAVHRLLREHFSTITVTIGIGKPCAQLPDVHMSYQQACLALQTKFYCRQGQVIEYNERLAAFAPGEAYPAAEEQKLFECVKSAETPREIEAAVDRFYRHLLQGGPIAIKSVYEMTIRLLVGMEKRFLAATDHEDEFQRNELIAVIHMETLQEVKQYVCSSLIQARKLLGWQERESHRSVIKKTIQYMEHECQHATLYSVAKKVYMTPAYLSLLFKANTGKTFIEQLTDIRIDKAKDMLKSTHLKNYEVAEKVGYQDSRYFSQIFKKKVGVSPSEYRELAVK